MGCCLGANAVCNEQPNKWEKFNVIDKKYNVIIGTYYNGYDAKKSSTIVSQGICIGYNNYKINKMIFGIGYLYDNKKVELYFENNIKLIIGKDNGHLKMILFYNNKTIIEKYIEHDIIKKYNKINKNSEYIDLIYDLMNDKKN